MSRREVRRRLVAAGSGINLAALLSGRLDIKLRHVLDLSRVLGIHPLEFFRLVVGAPEQRSPLLRTLDDLVSPARPQPLPRGPLVGRNELKALAHRVDELARAVGRLSAALPPGSSLHGARSPADSLADNGWPVRRSSAECAEVSPRRRRHGPGSADDPRRSVPCRRETRPP
ncbi:MAG TPA: hypothetical protein VHQ90_00910 [Thermoanaerobaculia bacterium]|nr:hypothetical protein [Thermoanaerobaculia bacterium]